MLLFAGKNSLMVRRDDIWLDVENYRAVQLVAHVLFYMPDRTVLFRFVMQCIS